MTEELQRCARTWLAEDPDPGTRAELEALLAAGDAGELADAFGEPLQFGTAGIRGRLGPGPARMNRLVVRRVTAGLAGRLAEDGPPESQLVVVGRDARHGSPAFAADTVGVLAAAGFDVAVFPHPVPTPLLAFAVRYLEAAAGVQITASHNPPADNGYKVFWAGGSQIAPPLDAEIASHIEAAGTPGGIPLDEGAGWMPDRAIEHAYRRACLALLRHREHRDLSLVLTPLHGVAGDMLVSLLADAGFADVASVTAQHEPDADFPTVAFPNPEEPGALDLALALADDVGADLVLATDPDGDRIGAAVPDQGGWRVLSGDEIGCVLAEYLLREGPPDPDRIVATTVVSSRLLSRIAASHGVRYAETLTGFKWLARAVAEAEAHGARPVLAYEQALGVMAGDAVRDKDGISAALVLADLAAHLAAQGRTIDDELDDLARRHGVHRTLGRSVRLEGDEATELVARALDALADRPPDALAGTPVSAVNDHRVGRRRGHDGQTAELDTPPTELVGVELVDGSRAQVRPSGTEPLLKCYLEVVEPVHDNHDSHDAHDDLAAAYQRADERVAALGDEFLAMLGLDDR